MNILLAMGFLVLVVLFLAAVFIGGAVARNRGMSLQDAWDHTLETQLGRPWRPKRVRVFVQSGKRPRVRVLVPLADPMPSGLSVSGFADPDRTDAMPEAQETFSDIFRCDTWSLSDLDAFATPEIKRILVEAWYACPVRFTLQDFKVHAQLIGVTDLEDPKVARTTEVLTRLARQLAGEEVEPLTEWTGEKGPLPPKAQEKLDHELVMKVDDLGMRGLRRLLDEGAEPDARDDQLKTPMMKAIWDRDKVEELLNRGADPGARDKWGMTPLMHAAYRGATGVIEQVLLPQGTDVNARDVEQCTALMHAGRGQDDPRLVEVLLDHGAELEAKSHLGFTALHWACDGEVSPEVVLALVEAGADMHAKSQEGYTPISLLQNNDHWALIELVEQITSRGT